MLQNSLVFYWSGIYEQCYPSQTESVCHTSVVKTIHSTYNLLTLGYFEANKAMVGCLNGPYNSPLLAFPLEISKLSHLALISLLVFVEIDESTFPALAVVQ